MMDINIHKNMNDYDVIYIKTDEGDFFISFAGNLDLYWVYDSNKPFFETLNENTITITKENYYLYTCFEQLFEAIKNDTPNSNSSWEYDKDNKVPEYASAKTIKLLTDNNTICWHSDDFMYDEASSVTIKQEDEEFKVTFKKSSNKEYFQTFSVRFRNSGSRYAPFNQTFMHMYNKLREYDYQIHFEEVLYKKNKYIK